MRRASDADIEPLVERPSSYLAAEMDAGRLRRGDPRLVAALAYATVTGIATEPEALRAVGWQPHRRRAAPPARRAARLPAAPPCTRRDGQCLVLRRRRAWRSSASATSSSISSG